MTQTGQADMFCWPNDRCELYIWQAANGEIYLGQSVNVRRRLTEHQRSHQDLQIAAFLSVARADLDLQEARLARMFEAVGPVRNIKLVTRSFAVVPYDIAVRTHEPNPRAMPEQEIKAAKNWRLFCRHPHAKVTVALLRHFADQGLANVWTTEARFWSATAFPDGGVRVNCGQQEIFTCWPTQDGDFQVRVLCDRSLDWKIKARIYQTRSWEHVWSDRKLLAFRDWQKVRAFSEYLMRHTTALNATNHCPQLFRNWPEQGSDSGSFSE